MNQRRIFMRNILIFSLVLGSVHCGPKKTKAGFRIETLTRALLSPLNSQSESDQKRKFENRPKKLKKERCPHIDSGEYLQAISIKLQNIVTG